MGTVSKVLTNLHSKLSAYPLLLAESFEGLAPCLIPAVTPWHPDVQWVCAE